MAEGRARADPDPGAGMVLLISDSEACIWFLPLDFVKIDPEKAKVRAVM